MHLFVGRAVLKYCKDRMVEHKTAVLVILGSTSTFLWGLRLNPRVSSLVLFLVSCGLSADFTHYPQLIAEQMWCFSVLNCWHKNIKRTSMIMLKQYLSIKYCTNMQKKKVGLQLMIIFIECFFSEQKSKIPKILHLL